MTPNQYRSDIAALGLSQIKAAKVLGVAERTSRRYALKGVPEKHAAWVREKFADYSHSAAFEQMAKASEKGNDDDQ